MQTRLQCGQGGQVRSLERRSIRRAGGGDRRTTCSRVGGGGRRLHRTVRRRRVGLRRGLGGLRMLQAFQLLGAELLHLLRLGYQRRGQQRQIGG